MKSSFFKLLFFILLPIGLSAQVLPNKYFGIRAFGAYSALNNKQPGTYNIKLLDQSSRKLDFNFEKEIKEQNHGFSLGFGIEFGKVKGLNHQINAILALNKVFAAFDYNIGYGFATTIGFNDLLIRPNIGIGTETGYIEFGKFSVDTLGVKFENTIVKGENQEVKLRQRHYNAHVGVDLTFLMGQKRGIRVTGGYRIPISEKEQILSAGAAILTDKSTALKFSYKGQPATIPTVDFNPLYFQVGYVFFMARD